MEIFQCICIVYTVMLIVMLVNILVTCVFPHSPLLFCDTLCVSFHPFLLRTLFTTRENRRLTILIAIGQRSMAKQHPLFLHLPQGERGTIQKVQK